jgi:formylglycine-generating enzyme required for sulfatase activity
MFARLLFYLAMAVGVAGLFGPCFVVEQAGVTQVLSGVDILRNWLWAVSQVLTGPELQEFLLMSLADIGPHERVLAGSSSPPMQATAAFLAHDLVGLARPLLLVMAILQVIALEVRRRGASRGGGWFAVTLIGLVPLVLLATEDGTPVAPVALAQAWQTPIPLTAFAVTHDSTGLILTWAHYALIPLSGLFGLLFRQPVGFAGRWVRRVRRSRVRGEARVSDGPPPPGMPAPTRHQTWMTAHGSDAHGYWAEAEVLCDGASHPVLASTVLFRFRFCPPGRFVMGSPETEAGRFPNEGPQHEVEVTRGFWLTETPVTQEQWQAVTGQKAHSRRQGMDLPVSEASRPECDGFLARLREHHPGLSPRLPTEAEWEYACRAGTTSPTYFGGNDDATLDRISWYSENSGPSWLGLRTSFTWKPRPVKKKAPNPWGLHDMLGNVWEWCSTFMTDYRGFSPEAPLHLKYRQAVEGLEEARDQSRRPPGEMQSLSQARLADAKGAARDAGHLAALHALHQHTLSLDNLTAEHTSFGSEVARGQAERRQAIVRALATVRDSELRGAVARGGSYQDDAECHRAAFRKEAIWRAGLRIAVDD